MYVTCLMMYPVTSVMQQSIILVEMQLYFTLKLSHNLQIQCFCNVAIASRAVGCNYLSSQETASRHWTGLCNAHLYPRQQWLMVWRPIARCRKTFPDVYLARISVVHSSICTSYHFCKKFSVQVKAYMTEISCHHSF